MTSLTETLPILDEAVPALPGKVDAVARKGDDFHRAAQEAVGQLQQRRAEADALVDQVRQALEAFGGAAAEDEQRVEQLTRALQQAAEEEARGAGEYRDEMHTAGAEAVAAFDRLEVSLVQAADRTDGAHEDARGALDALSEEARTSESELEAAADAMASAVGTAEDAIREGSDLVSQAMTSLKEAMLRVLADARERLDQTYQRLDDVREGQAKAVEEAMSSLDADLGTLGQDLQQRVQAEVQQTVDPDLRAVEAALGEMGRQVVALESETEAARARLTEELTAVADRTPPLQGGVQQVKQAAEQVGIAWP
jgi:ABC-type transporter Mla subunit MlaD